MTADEKRGNGKKWPVRVTKPLLYQLSYIGLKSLRRIMPRPALLASKSTLW
jgi:hypothetical protein